jgi:hypothetical protein
VGTVCECQHRTPVRLLFKDPVTAGLTVTLMTGSEVGLGLMLRLKC